MARSTVPDSVKQTDQLRFPKGSHRSPSLLALSALTLPLLGCGEFKEVETHAQSAPHIDYEEDPVQTRLTIGAEATKVEVLSHQFSEQLRGFQNELNYHPPLTTTTESLKTLIDTGKELREGISHLEALYGDLMETQESLGLTPEKDTEKTPVSLAQE